MKTLFKATLVAGALALSSLAASSPAAAQSSFGFSFGTYGGDYYGNYNYGRPYYGNYYNRNCRLVTRVRYDRWGYPHRVRTQVCRPYRAPYRAGYGYPGYGYGW